MKKRILFYIIIIILLFCLSSIFVIPELNNCKRIMKIILTGILLCSTIYNITKSRLFIKILFIVMFLFIIIIGDVLEPTKGSILESDKYYITKLNDIYLYRKYVLIDGYVLLYKKDKHLPILTFKTIRQIFTGEDDKIDLKEIEGKIYIQINNEKYYLIE